MPAILALCALVVLRLVDLAVFDPEHAHLEAPHMQAHAMEMDHHQDGDEPSEHESVDNMVAHVSFHTLLSVYTATPVVAGLPINFSSSKYWVHLGKHVNDAQLRPPVPPPLT
ncbi:MAG: hypothetical protein JKY60_10700 [Kordiimonadaceae bacterium]|nr:hypothetical protein [Kordiimonadaceae bacterium]